jgi:methionyl-tRNA formyltransferase
VIENNRIKLLFVGSAQFAVPVLSGLLADEEWEIVGVVTQPPKPVGREQVLTATAVEQFILNAPERGAIPIFHPEKLKSVALDILEQTQPDIILVVAYGQIIPQVMLDYPKYKCVNIHGSLLPRWRGAVPVHMGVLHGDQLTGITWQQMVMQLDAGPIIAQSAHPITAEATTGKLLQELAYIAATQTSAILQEYCRGTIVVKQQEESEATYSYEADIAKDKAEIKWHTPVDVAERMVRAFNPWPIAWTQISHQGQVKRLKLLQTRPYELNKSANETVHPYITLDNQKRLLLHLADGSLELVTVQLEGKGVGDAKDYRFLAL